MEILAVERCENSEFPFCLVGGEEGRCRRSKLPCASRLYRRLFCRLQVCTQMLGVPTTHYEKGAFLVGIKLQQVGMMTP